MKTYRFIARALTLVTIVSLTACLESGKGIDAKLVMTDEPRYRKALAVAWKDMTQAQREAFNWAVSDFDLYNLMAAYPKGTPREVISSEADKYIKQQSELLAKYTATYQVDYPILEKQEKQIEEVKAELKKITAGDAKLIFDSHGYLKELAYTTTNNSQYDIGSAQWKAWVFLNGEQRTTRSMDVYASYGHYKNGLKSGASTKMTESTFSSDQLKTAEVKTAKEIKIQLELDLLSVNDLGERRIMPFFEKRHIDYKEAIAKVEANIEGAKAHKATLN